MGLTLFVIFVAAFYLVCFLFTLFPSTQDPLLVKWVPLHPCMKCRRFSCFNNWKVAEDRSQDSMNIQKGAQQIRKWPNAAETKQIGRNLQLIGFLIGPWMVLGANFFRRNIFSAISVLQRWVLWIFFGSAAAEPRAVGRRVGMLELSEEFPKEKRGQSFLIWQFGSIKIRDGYFWIFFDFLHAIWFT